MFRFVKFFALAILGAAISFGASQVAAQDDPHAVDLKLVAKQGQSLIYAFANPKDVASPDQIVRQFRFVCDQQGTSVCVINFWKNEADAPRALPMTDRQVNSQFLSYTRNRNTSHEELLKSRENGTDAMDEYPIAK